MSCMSETNHQTDGTQVQQDVVARQPMTPEQAWERLQKGQPIENAKIERLLFRGELAQPVRMKNCLLIRPTFDHATFKHDVNLNNCVLDRPIFRQTTHFEQGLNVSSSTFNQALILDVHVTGVFNAGNCVGTGSLQFVRCRFDGLARFWDSHFRSWASFKECMFHDDADFRSVQCDQGLKLTECHFHRGLLLRGATIEKKLEPERSQVDGIFDLSKAKLHDFAYLEGVVAGPKQTWAFLNAVAERILIQPEQLEGRLSSEQNRDYTAAMQEYGLLKKSYENLHRYDQEDWAFYRFKINQRRGVGRSWKKPWTKFNQFCNWLLLDLGCGYGTNPRRAILTAFVIIGLFASVYMYEIQLLHIEKLPFPELPLTAWQNRLLISLMASVTVFTSGLSGIRDMAQGWMNIPLLIESLLGTLLWGLFIVAFSRKVIR
ncbi:MAG: hypothetical protein JWM11_2405 [Planctomycetaceae bacterium]|nr:hypothetical protein [Planctomycetaceae bacterium]